jgi:hypothetical protein
MEVFCGRVVEVVAVLGDHPKWVMPGCPRRAGLCRGELPARIGGTQRVELWPTTFSR